jgi:hypothetical protein
MIITILLIALFISFSIHIFSLFNFVTKKSETAIKIFIVTTMSNVSIAGACIVIILYSPEVLQEVDVAKITWTFTGIIMLIALTIKIRIFIRIYKRAKDPENYHINYFGKKVLHSTVINKLDLIAFFGTIPFLLIAGAYFIAKLINYLK